MELYEVTNEEQQNEETVNQPTDTDHIEQIEEPYSIAINREQRQIRRPLRYVDTMAYTLNIMEADPASYALAMVDNIVGDEPYTYKEAVSGYESSE